MYKKICLRLYSNNYNTSKYGLYNIFCKILLMYMCMYVYT